MRRSRSAIAIVVSTLCWPPLHAQKAQSTHVVIPFLASAAKSSSLEFDGAECEANRSGTSMRCEFQQVFLTTADIAPDTCLITTNRYARTFRKESRGRWVSSGAATGPCGVMDVVTLTDEGGVRWTMEVKKIATRKNAVASCAAAEEPSELLSWRDLRRPLPCRFVQPGGLSR